MFFFAQSYFRQAQRPDTMDVWPSQASQEEKAFNSQLLPAHQQGQTQPHQPVHSPLQNGAQLGEPVSPARSNSSRSSAGSQGSPGKPCPQKASCLSQLRLSGSRSASRNQNDWHAVL